MPHNKRLIEHKIVALNASRDLQLSQRKIAKKLHRFQNAFGNELRKGENYGKEKTGRPHELTECGRRRLIRMARRIENSFKYFKYINCNWMYLNEP